LETVTGGGLETVTGGGDGAAPPPPPQALRKQRPERESTSRKVFFTVPPEVADSRSAWDDSAADPNITLFGSRQPSFNEYLSGLHPASIFPWRQVCCGTLAGAANERVVPANHELSYPNIFAIPGPMRAGISSHYGFYETRRLDLSAQSSSCMRRKLFLYTALPIAFPKRSPAT
jgi:hypothetical protein